MRVRNKGEDTDLLEMQSFINPFKFDNLVIIISIKTICDDKKLVNCNETPVIKEKKIITLKSLIEEYDLGTETTEIIKITKRNYTMERRE